MSAHERGARASGLPRAELYESSTLLHRGLKPRAILGRVVPTPA
jgi:hypothetical protein